MRIAQMLIAAVVATATSSAALAQPTVYGGGNVSCGTYSTYKVQDLLMYTASTTWTMGYLTAMSQQLQIDLLKGTDLNGAIAWLDNYCAQNPIELYVTANYQLVLFLGRRQKNSN
jgi:hypothetical protein